MFTELLQAEVWRKKLEAAGYRVIPDAWERNPPEPIRESRERTTRSTTPPAMPMPPP